MLDALDVAIGLVLVYLLLSLFATNVGEAIAQVFSLRAGNLRRAVTRLLGGSEALAKEFYDDPRIRSLSMGTRDPSYLPPETFAEVVLDLVVGTGGADLPAGKRGDVIAGFGWGNETESTARTEPGRSAACEEARARRQLATVLERISTDAGDDGARMRAGAAQWFGAAMDRASGAYRRTMQRILLGIGFSIAIAVDADTLRISSELMKNSTVLDALVRSAAGEAPQLEDIRPLIGWTLEEWVQAVDKPSGLPAKLLGMLLTALAVGLGAPFWFNALQRLLQLRSSLRPSDRPPSADAPTGRDVAAVTSVPAALSTAGVSTAPSRILDPAAVFEPDAVVYTPGNAWVFAVASQAAYLGLPGFTEALPGTWETIRIAESETDTLVYVALSDRAVIVAFRGTESMGDLLTDISVDFDHVEKNLTEPPTTVPEMAATTRQTASFLAKGAPAAAMHAGFKRSLDAVWPGLERELIAATDGVPRAVHFCGHSLGGALAVLASERWKAGRNDRGACVYTYGQPRCGNQGYAEELDRRIGDRLFRHVNHRDAVPRLPPRTFGYRHAGRCLYFDARAQLHDSPATWFQVLDTIPIAPGSLLSHMRETVGDHGSQEYVRLTRAQLG